MSRLYNNAINRFKNISVDSVSQEAVSFTAANTLAQEHSGDVLFLASTTGTALTLPAPSASLRFDITISALPLSGQHSIVAPSAILAGTISATTTPITTASATTLTTGAGSALGDRVSLISDGSTWFVNGTANAIDAFVFA